MSTAGTTLHTCTNTRAHAQTQKSKDNPENNIGEGDRRSLFLFLQSLRLLRTDLCYEVVY